MTSKQRLFLGIIGALVATGGVGAWYLGRTSDQAMLLFDDDNRELHVESLYLSTRVVLAETESRNVLWERLLDGTGLGRVVTEDRAHVGFAENDGRLTPRRSLQVLRVSDGVSVRDAKLSLPPKAKVAERKNALSNDARWFAQIEADSSELSSLTKYWFSIYSLEDGSVAYRQTGKHWFGAFMSFSPGSTRVYLTSQAADTRVFEHGASGWQEIAQFEAVPLAWDGDDQIYGRDVQRFVRWSEGEGLQQLPALKEARIVDPLWFVSRAVDSGRYYGVVIHDGGLVAVDLKLGQPVFELETDVAGIYDVAVLGRGRLGVISNGSVRVFDMNNSELVLHKEFKPYSWTSNHYNLGGESTNYAQGRFSSGGRYVIYPGVGREEERLPLY